MVDFSVGDRVQMRPDARKVAGINYRRDMTRVGTITAIVHGVHWVYVHWDGRTETKATEYPETLQLTNEEAVE